MKPTELFVEQVFVGLLVLGVFTLPFLLGELPDDSSRLLGIAAAFGVPVVGLAYLLGVVFDRFADTLLSRAEQIARLRFAQWVKKRERDSSSSYARQGDPFPEDLLRIRAMVQGEVLGEWMNYLRTRIRLARSLAVFLPALTVSAALAIVKMPCIQAIGLGLIALVYAAAFFATVCDDGRMSPPKLPRTDDPNLDSRLNELRIGQEPAVLGVLALALLGTLALVAAAVCDSRTRPLVGLLLVGGAVLSALSAWSWWTITHTFMNLLEAFRRHGT